MTQRFANALLGIGGYMLCLALVFMFVAGVQSFFDVAFAPALFLLGAMLLILSMGLLIGGFCLDHQLEEWAFEQRRRQPTAKIPLDTLAKEPGYNGAVIDWFHNGPELRDKGEDFHKGFAARALVPPPSTRRRR